MNKKYQEYKEAGLCRRCGSIPIDGKTRCEKCNSDHLLYQKRAKNKAIEAGLCRHCLTNKKHGSKTLCLSCLEKHKEYNKVRSQELRKLCVQNYGGKCVCCGQSNFKYLQLDHVDNDGKFHRKETSNMYAWAVANNYPKRLQLLCANCHQAKSCFGGCTEEDHPL